MVNKITFSSCFYNIKSKFDKDIYINWLQLFLTVIKHNVDSCNLVFYTDEDTLGYIKQRIPFEDTDTIKIIVKPMTMFYTYKYKKEWVLNHVNNKSLIHTNWSLNMLWSEKISFVQDTIHHKYFDTEWYGWCDSGYFRNRIHDMLVSDLDSKWPNTDLIATSDPEKIIYGCVSPHTFNDLKNIILNQNSSGLPVQPIPMNQVSVAGGFFLIHKNKINWWANIYYEKLRLYFENQYLVKDDQILLVDCITNHLNDFHLCTENYPNYDCWFMFQRILYKSFPKITIDPNKKMVSILIPIYNGIEFIQESISSVLQQTYDKWELIIGINGHPPNSDVYKIAKQYEGISNKIRVIDFYMHKSKPSTLNAMIPYCNSNYVAILDVDDVWEPTKLIKQSQYMYTYDVIGTKCIYFGETAPIVPNIPVGNISYYNFLNQNPIINSSSLIKKELCNWSEFFLEDYELWLSLWIQHKTFFNIEESLVGHRIHSKSAFNSKHNTGELKELIDKYTRLRTMPMSG